MQELRRALFTCVMKNNLGGVVGRPEGLRVLSGSLGSGQGGLGPLGSSIVQDLRLLEFTFR